MSTAIEFAPGDLNDCILPSQYNDLFRRHSPVSEGECRLLLAVVEDAVRTYLRNKTCSNRIQRKNFEEVRSWFEPAQYKTRGLFGFRTICDLLEIDSERLLKGLRSLDAREFQARRRRLVRNAAPRSVPV